MSFEGGRAKGAANTVGPDGAKSVTIDTSLAAGTLDDNAIQALLPAFRWRPGAKWTIPVFSASENAARTVTLAVSATEAVTLEGGISTEAYRAELTGGPQPVTFWMTTRLVGVMSPG